MEKNSFGNWIHIARIDNSANSEKLFSFQHKRATEIVDMDVTSKKQVCTLCVRDLHLKTTIHRAIALTAGVSAEDT